MQFGKHTYEQIEQYLSGELTGADLANFEQKITQNAELAEEIEAHKTAEDIIFQNGLLDIQAQLQSIHSNHTVPIPPKPKGGNWKIYTITALVGTALLPTLWLTNQPTNTEIITQQPIKITTATITVTRPKIENSHKINSTQHNPTKNTITQPTEETTNHAVVID
ncbi:MAG: hypothetical protein ACI81T_001011 [Bacteroidia bacterium]|jgi:hypothetical protein